MNGARTRVGMNMKLDLNNPKQGLYRMTRDVFHKRPDGRAARGWDSREGTPKGTLVRVTVWKPRFDRSDYDHLPADKVDIIQAAHEARGPEIDLGLPGRYHRAMDVRVDFGPHTLPETVATVMEIVDALELVEDGQGQLDAIDPKCNCWEEILAMMIDHGDVKIEVVQAAYEAFWKKVHEEYKA